MVPLLPPLPLLAAFAAASLVLAVTPGPGVVFIVARSLAQGRGAGLASAAGVAAGNWCNALGAAVGLAALFAVSAAAFTLVKWAGAAYLVYLGFALLCRRIDGDRATVPTAQRAARIFADGFLVALLNPKTTVFFTAFLPQFMTNGASAAQGILLGSLFVAIAVVTDSLYALLASSAAPLLRRAHSMRRGGRILAGGTLVGLGIYTAVAGGQPSARATRP